MKKFRRSFVLLTLSTLSLAYLAAGIIFRADAANVNPEGINNRNVGSHLFAGGGQTRAPILRSFLTSLSPGLAVPDNITQVSSSFTPGDLVVYRVGDGSAALSNAATIVFLDEYTPAGTLVRSIALPTADNGASKILTAAGTSTSEGFLSLSSDQRYIFLTGYDKAPGGASPNSDAPATTNRVVGRVDAFGNVNTTTALNDPTGNIRGVTANNGSDLWITSSSNGIRYAPFGTVGGSTQLSTTVANLRVPAIFGGQLYVSDSSGTSVRLGAVGDPSNPDPQLPTTSGQTITNLPGFPTAGAPYGFFFANLDSTIVGNDTLYVADDTPGTILKYSLVPAPPPANSSWVANGSISVPGVRGLTGLVQGSNVTLYATTAGAIQNLTDI